MSHLPAGTVHTGKSPAGVTYNVYPKAGEPPASFQERKRRQAVRLYEQWEARFDRGHRDALVRVRITEGQFNAVNDVLHTLGDDERYIELSASTLAVPVHLVGDLATMLESHSEDIAYGGWWEPMNFGEYSDEQLAHWTKLAATAPLNLARKLLRACPIKRWV